MCNTSVECRIKHEGKIYTRTVHPEIGKKFVFNPLDPSEHKNRGRPVIVVFYMDKEENINNNFGPWTESIGIIFTDKHEFETEFCQASDLDEPEPDYKDGIPFRITPQESNNLRLDTRTPEENVSAAKYVLPELPWFMIETENYKRLIDVYLLPEFAAWLEALSATVDSWNEIPDFLEDIFDLDETNRHVWVKGFLFAVAMHGGAINSCNGFPDTDFAASDKIWDRMALNKPEI